MESSGVFGWRFLVLLLVSAALNAAAMDAAGATIRLDPILQGLATPVYVTNAHDGTHRLFVVEQPGRVMALAAGATAPSLFLDISSKVRFGGEQGLLGLAFHPQFATNSRFFVDYTRLSDGATVIAEYRASADPDVTAASETVLLVIARPHANLNGGMIEFGGDGYLYLGVGDGDDANDAQSRARNVDEQLGKILRIDVDHPAEANLYSSPASDPEAGTAPGRDDTFAVGIRNPFRFSFDRETGQLYVGDVGQRPLEETGSLTAGGNSGWRGYDGTRCAGLDPALCVPANLVAPIARYDYSDGRCSIIGGYVYRGSAAALPAGTYVFGDFCTGEIFSLAGGRPDLLLDTSSNISSFGEDEAGEIYVVGLRGTVHRIASAATTSSSSGLAVGTHSIVANSGGSTPFSQTISDTTGAAAATFVGADVATKGNWHGVYGADGYAVLNDSTSYPAYAQVTPSGQQSYVWDAQPSDARALQRATTGRIAACWYSPGLVGSSFSIDVNLTDGAAHRVALYLLDWDNNGRVVRIDVLDAATQQVLSTQNLQSFSGGTYLVWNLQGHVILRITSTGGSNAVLSGLFFDAPAGVTTYAVSGTVTSGGNPLPGVSFFSAPVNCTTSNAQGQYSCTVPQGWTGSITPSLSGYAFTPASRSYSSVAANQTGQNYTATSTVVPNSATFVGADATTKGNWHGVYGNDGYAVLNDSTNYPAYAQVTPSGQQSYVWDAQPGDARALQRATTGRIAACWYSPGLVGSSFSIDINLTDGAAHRVALYLLDWDSTTRVNRVDVLDAGTQQVLSTQTLQSFNGGVYLVWNLQGHVIVRITSTGGSNAVLSGLFFDAFAGLTTYTVSGTVTSGGNPLSGVSFAATGTASCPAASNAQGQYSCTVPQGWTGSITPSLSGYAFTPASRSYSSVAANQTGQNYTATSAAASATTLTSAPNPAVAGSSVTFTATVTGNNPTGSVTFTEGGNPICAAGTLSGSPRTASCSTSALSVGTHSIVANYAGDAGNTASSSTPVSQGITAVPNSATFVGADATTKGDWRGVYGNDGYAVLNDSTNYPAYAQVTPSGQQSYVWDAQPSDARALQRATTGRIAACWYSPGLVGSSFSIDINLTDGAAHRVALYLLDWDSTTRVNRVDVLDAGTQQVLSTQTLQSFNGGVYLVWNLQGHVIVRITSTGGSNAVLSGLFFDAFAGLTTYTVSGTVTSGGNPLSGVSFAATGTASCPAASNAQGQYSCTVPQGWTGSITPSLSGYAFTPASRSYTSVAANQTGQNYTATSAAASATTLTSAPNPAIAGSSVTFTATVTGNNPTGSVTFIEGGNAICAAGTLSGSPRTASCSTSALSVGTHSIVANYAGDAGNTASSSTPLAQTINGSGLTLTLSGTVYADNGQPLAGVRFDASTGQFSCPDSDSSGHYFCTVPDGWSGTVTPSLAGYEFTPTQRTYENVRADDTQDFLGFPH